MSRSSRDFSQVRVLIFEDSQALRSMECSMLKELGITRIDQVRDRCGAIELLEHNRYDLIVCDWEMSTVSGIEVLTEIRSNSATAEIPFLMVTAQSRAEKAETALAAGVDDYLLKPFQQDRFNYKVARLLGTVAPADAAAR